MGFTSMGLLISIFPLTTGPPTVCLYHAHILFNHQLAYQCCWQKPYEFITVQIRTKPDSFRKNRLNEMESVGEQRWLLVTHVLFNNYWRANANIIAENPFNISPLNTNCVGLTLITGNDFSEEFRNQTWSLLKIIQIIPEQNQTCIKHIQKFYILLQVGSSDVQLCLKIKVRGTCEQWKRLFMP